MDYLRSARVSRIQKKIPNTTIRNQMQEEQNIWTELHQGNWNDVGTSLEWIIYVGGKTPTSGHRTLGKEVEDRNNHAVAK
jgi:hypothetical protein